MTDNEDRNHQHQAREIYDCFAFVFSFDLKRGFTRTFAEEIKTKGNKQISEGT
jgi:hypothetical protein